MTSKRILGFVFIFFAILFSIAIVGQLPELIGTIMGIFIMFSGKFDSYQTGEIFGRAIFWALLFTATIALWKYGIRWSKKQVKP